MDGKHCKTMKEIHITIIVTTNKTQWEKPKSLSLGAASRVAAVGKRLKDRADVELAQFAYKDPNDPARQQMLTDMRNAESPFDVRG